MTETIFDAQQIMNAYLSAAPRMRLRMKFHFYERSYRITGDSNHLAILNELLAPNIKQKLSEFSRLLSFTPDVLPLVDDVRATIRRHPIENKRIIRREEYYKTDPILKFYLDSLYYLDRLLNLDIEHSPYAADFEDVIKLYRTFDWRQRFFRSDYFQIHPVEFINSIYALRNLGIIDLVPELLEMISKVFPYDLVQSDELLYDQIYSYTHVIINETRFYQYLLVPEQIALYQSIYAFLSRHFEEFYQQVNVDLVLETLICFRLTTIPYYEMEKTAFTYLEQFRDEATGCLKTDSEATLEDMEHANVLLLIYLLFPSQFFRAKNVFT